jgi:hypothetical protein
MVSGHGSRQKTACYLTVTNIQPERITIALLQAKLTSVLLVYPRGKNGWIYARLFRIHKNKTNWKRISSGFTIQAGNPVGYLVDVR